jgi:lipopolysaccharide/colanic/teichoic acid biosynthesis glycosyltransferase
VSAPGNADTWLDEARAPLRKRLADLVIAVPMLVVLTPVFALAALLVKTTSKGPILFRQERIGWRGDPFRMLKFRTMVLNDDDDALREINRQEITGERSVGEGGSFKLANDPRITRVGGWLRATSVDELPQLVNVLRGQMSLVGPRPALAWEVDLFPPQYRCRTDVLPGITGLWQVSGRSRLSTLDMLRLDIDYRDGWSFALDLRILLKTLPAIARGDGSR